MNKEELIKIFSAYLPYQLEFKLPLSSDRYDDITEGSWWRVAHTLETAIEAQIPEALKLRDMVMCQQDPYLAIEDDRIFLGYLVTNLGFELDDIFLDEVKPILYDLSYLTKEIEHEGKRFIPLIELAKINAPQRRFKINGSLVVDDYGYHFFYNQNSFIWVHGVKAHTVINQRQLFERRPKRRKWMVKCQKQQILGIRTILSRWKAAISYYER